MPSSGIGDGLAVAEEGVVAEKGFAVEFLGFGGRDAEGKDVDVDLLATFEEERGDLGLERVGHSLLRQPEGICRVFGVAGRHRGA